MKVLDVINKQLLKSFDKSHVISIIIIVESFRPRIYKQG